MNMLWFFPLAILIGLAGTLLPAQVQEFRLPSGLRCLLLEKHEQPLIRVALDCRCPTINGVVVAESEAQAEARCLGKINRGDEFAQAALAMAALRRDLVR